MMGPGRGGGRRGAHSGQKTKLDWKTFARLMKMILTDYKVQLVIVLIAIVISSLASVAGSVFLRILIDSYITPIASVGLAATLPPMIRALGIMLLIYLGGILSSFTYNILMVTISQGTLRTIRDDMFAHMQSLPIKYFDTRSHGDMMSLYTNDTNTLRQMVTQSIPNFLNASITVTAIFFAMLFTSWHLTIVVLLSLTAMLFISTKIAKQSGTHFVAQQKTIGATNGYIEELISGQRVVQTFTYEERAKEAFDKLNDQLFEDAFNANRYANILMPIMGNISYIQWVIVAIVGGSLAISGLAPLTLGAIASFLQLSRTINRPINQMAQQLNSVAMALAGTKRIFELLDQEGEQDSGHITLTHTERAENGSIRPCCEAQDNSWAWEDAKRNTLIPLTGHVELDHVDFGYVEDTLVLQD
ncbi:MAG TPA: ABC transporter ATP-binding protein, partial [Sphaerochaeta sp.]|nr:ABC transporter ATP-binding protein [Sphaerochaeta sp.]